VLRTFGWATIIIGVISGVVICANDSASAGIAIIIGSIFAGIIYIGIAQTVDYLARTAFFTDRLCTIMESSMRIQSKSVEALTRPSADKKSIPPPPPPPMPTTRTPAVYHFAMDGSNQGPFTHIDMKDFRAAGVVVDDTPVFCDGEAEWRTYRDFQELIA
jgi:hypothetical protein